MDGRGLSITSFLLWSFHGPLFLSFVLTARGVADRCSAGWRGMLAVAHTPNRPR